MPASTTSPSSDTLRSRLSYEPRDLKFGTSGRRGEVAHLTQLEVYINVLAELEYLQGLSVEDGGIARGQEVYLAFDLRPSSTAFVPEQQGRGEIAQAAVQAIRDAGMLPVNMGSIPTPALANYGLVNGRATIMITGSHIPFDRNGYKTSRATGELRKEDEQPINEITRAVRDRVYNQPFSSSLFDDRGQLKPGHSGLPTESDAARNAYISRYETFFPAGFLRNRQILFYEHSAVGRDLVAALLESFGAKVIRRGRSSTFIPIDTEAIDDALLSALQTMADEAAREHGSIWAIISTDGDSDRPLILGVDQQNGKARFISGDLAGMIVAEYLGADAVVVPVSCNDAIDRSSLAPVLQPKTRIGSPYVIAGMVKALSEGRQVVCGWEANGGFLTASAITRNGRTLAALPTRDAVLPILAVLSAAEKARVPLTEVLDRLPRRFNRATLIREYPRDIAGRMISAFTGAISDSAVPGAAGDDPCRAVLSTIFSAERSFSKIAAVDCTDGLRLSFVNGDVVHLRPSGNADEFRIYATADTQQRADWIAATLSAHPAGIVEELQQASRSLATGATAG